MNKEQIIENNRLIAEFMDHKVAYHKETDEYGINGEPLTCYIYNESWDLLIPVLQQIETVSHLLPEDSNLIGEITMALIDYNIEETYKAAVEFIKWYNQYKDGEQTIRKRSRQC